MEVLFPLMFPGWLNKLAGSIRMFASYRDKPENIASYIALQANCNACKHLSGATLGTSRKLMINESDGEFQLSKLNVKDEIINNDTNVGQRKNLSLQQESKP